MTEDVTAFPDRPTREHLYAEQRKLGKRFVFMFAVLVATSVFISATALGILIYMIDRETDDVREHRQRNEQLHRVMCERQDELAQELGVQLHILCPAPLFVGGDH
jgi:hypothetical protein